MTSTTSSVGRRPRLMGLGAVVLLGACASVAQGFGRFAYGVLLPAVRDDLGISNTVAGSLGMANVGAYLVGTLVVAMASGRLRLLMIMRIGLALSTIGLVISAVAPGAAVMAIGMMIAGLGGAFVWIPIPVIATGAVGPERRNLAVALMGSGIGTGVVVAGQLGGYVRSTLGDESWRTAYVVMAAIAIVVSTSAIVFIGHDQGRPAGGGQIGGFDVLRRMRGWIPLTAAYTAFGLMYLLVLAFVTTRLEDDNGWSGGDAATAFSLIGLATVIGGPFFIGLVGRIGARRALSLAFALWIVLVLIILPGWQIPTLAASVGIGLVFAGVPSMITLYVVANTTLEDYGPAFSAATLAFGLAQMVSPQLGGIVADVSGSFLPVFLLSVGLAVIGLIAALRLPRSATDPGYQAA